MAPAQIKNSYNSIGEIDTDTHPSTLELKLCVTNTSLRYFVLSASHQQVIFFGDYTMHHISNTNELVQRIEKIYEKDEVLQLAFGKVLIGIDEKYSLVPAEFSFMINRNEQLSQDCNGTEIVYEYPGQLVSVLQRLFAGAQLLHLNSTYLKLLPLYDDGARELFVNISKGHLDIIRFDAEQKLQLMNRYEYQTATDFIYFLLLCSDELKIDRENTKLVLLGEVSMQSKIYELCHRYFKNVSFITAPEGVQFSKLFAEFPRHLHFNLYNLSI
ncbi:MAG TPA: DUF3822 family protein [Chitinophagales bacterium]|nr:DUF3822 family protein [Chitinophagales bacterium]